ncbi:MAG: hypothetical protein ACIAQ0_02620 [Phycisphaerales bacterium JB058]
MRLAIEETAHRAEKHTPESINQKIHRETEQRLQTLAENPRALRARLAELDREWDIERCLETGSATLTLTGLLLGTTVNKRWLLLSLGVQGFLMQHALQGWCPPLPVFRALGVRTQHEIEAERHAIKSMLGEYDDQQAARANPNRTFHTAMS